MWGLWKPWPIPAGHSPSLAGRVLVFLLLISWKLHVNLSRPYKVFSDPRLPAQQTPENRLQVMVPVLAGEVRDLELIPGLGKSPGGGRGNPLWYSCLENPMDRGAWRTAVHRVAESRTRLRDFTFTFHFPALAIGCKQPLTGM